MSERLRARDGFVIARFGGRLQLLLFPCLKILQRLRDDGKSHMRMLQAAELRALAAINTRLLDLNQKADEYPGRNRAFL